MRVEETTGAQTVLDILQEWGVAEAFICPGSTEAAFLDATAQCAGFDIVLTTHDSVAVSMADGAARASGRPSVAYLHANVGLANGVAHLRAASIAYSPVLVMTGLKHRVVEARSGFTTAPFMHDYVRQHVKLAREVTRRETLAEEVRRALQVATAEPTGPVWLGLPEDVMEALGVDQPSPPARLMASRTESPAAQIDAAADELRRARRPVLIAGDEVVRRGGADELRQLAERLDAPVMSQDKWSAESMAFPTAHPNYVGSFDLDRGCVRAADLILSVGAKFVDFSPGPISLLPAHGSVIVQCHGDGAQIARRHPVDISLIGDVAASLRGLLDRIDEGEEAPQGRQDALDAARDEWRGSASHATTDGVLNVGTAVAVLNAALDRTAVVVGEAITASDTLFHGLNLQSAGRYLTSTSGSMGWGMGAALGVQYARPDVWVIAVVGDGVFQFGLPALWTAVDQRLPVTVLVLNNGRYAAVEAALRRYGGQSAQAGTFVGTNIGGPQPAMIAQGFGAVGRRVAEPQELATALCDARRERGIPTIIDAVVP